MNKEEGEADTTKSEKLRTIANNSIEHLKEKDLSKFTPEDQKTIESIKTIDTNQLTDDVLKQLIRTVDNIIENDNLINTGLIEVTSEIQKSLPLLDNIIAKEKPIIQEIGLWGELMNNPANILKRIYQKAKVEATVRMISINKYLAIGSNLEVEQDRAEASVDNKIKKIKKKYNTDVRDILQQSKLGLFGVLKQVRDIGEFSKVKRNVEVTIEGYSEAERAEESKAWETAWKPFEKVNTYEDLQKVLKSVEKQDTQVTELWQHFRDDLFTEKLQEESLKNAEKFHNTEFIPWDNYLPIVHTRVSDLVNTAEEIRTAGRGGGVVNSDISMKPKQASTSMKRNLSLSEGYVYSSTPIGDWLSKYAETIQDNALSKEQLRLSLLAKNKKFAALLGGNTNANMVIKAMKSMVATQRGLNNIVTKNSFERLMKVVSGSFRTIGTVRALGSVGQWIKQPVVLFKTAINLGTDVDLLAKGISATADIRKNGNKSPVKKLLNLTTLASRGLRLGKTDRGTASFYKFDKGAKRWFNEMLSEADVRLNKNSRVLLEKSIVTPDLFSAQSSFISYYLQSLREQGVKDVNLNTEFEKADQLERQLALAHAENMVEKTQTASNPAALSAIQGKTGSTGLDIMKNVYLPFSSFDADFKARFVSEVDGLIRNKDAHSAKELFGTLAEAGIYAAVSAVVIGAWREALRAAIRALSGSKAPEEDEEKDRKKKWKQFWGSYTQAVNPLALGSIGSDMSSSAINTLAYTLDTWEGPYISKKDWMKDNAIVYEPMDGPWYENMGVYSSGIAPIVEIGALAVDNPLGETIKVVDAYGNEKHIKISKEIAVLWSLKAMTEGLTLIGLTEADVANAVRAVYREQLKNGEKVNLHTPRGASNKKESNSLKLKKPKRLILKGGPHS